MEDIFKAYEAIKERGLGHPRDIYHPEFGWVLRKGKPTENTEEFYKWMLKQEK